MRTLYPTVIVIALGIAALMVGMSGFEAAVNENPTEGLESDDELESQANDSAANDEDGLQGGASSDDEDIVGLIISGSQAVASLAFTVVLLPIELDNMGFPRYFAYPLGLAGQLVVSVGVAQFAAGREWI